jgi:carbon dioxide concentrating mechanism protein CcmM
LRLGVARGLNDRNICLGVARIREVSGEDLQGSYQERSRPVIRKVAASLSLVTLLVLVSACGSETSQQNQDTQGSQQQRDSAQGGGSTQGGGQLTNIGRPPELVFNESSYVSPLTEIFGEILIGRENFIASSSVLRAAPGLRVELGDKSTAQDNTIVRAKNETVIISDESNLGHHAIVRDSKIGNSVYIGYNAEVSNSQVGNGALIYHGALVEGVEIPENSYVAAGEVITDQATADALPTVEEVGVDKYYQEALLDIHKELTQGYIELYESEGYDAVIDVGVNPKTPFNPEQIQPQIAESAELNEFVRVVGDVRVGENSTIGRRTAIRADEGTPISIGRGALIDDRVTFHAVKGTEIQTGEFLVVDDDAVLHGPLEMGDENVIGEGAVVFRTRLGNNVQIGEAAVIVGPPGDELTLEIPDDTIIPAGAVVTSKKDLEALEN